MAAFFISSTSYAQVGPYRVTGVGKNFDAAKQNAFRQAIEKYAGVVVVSNSESLNDKLIKDEILNYSAGYIDNYKILHNYELDGEYTIIMDVWVSSSKISQRILSTTGNKSINGPLIAEKHRSFIESKQNGDKIFKTVFDSYPHNAFNIKIVKTDIGVDSSRNTFVNIAYQISWNKNWINSLYELFGMLYSDEGTKPVMKVLFYDDPKGLRKRFTYYDIYEPETHWKINVLLKNVYPQVRVNFLDGHKVVWSQCHNFRETYLINKDSRHEQTYSMEIYNTNVLSGVLTNYIINSKILQNITEVRAEIVSNKQCK